MKIDELKEMISKDAAFLKEESHMDTSSLSIPELHSKYLSLIYDERLALDYFKVEYKVLRDSTALGDAVFGDHSGNGSRSDLWTTAHFAYVDSPSSTSSLTYKVQHKTFNTDITSTASHQNNKCTIILQEIVA